MPDITYVKGDATDPASLGPKIIAHVCNDVGGWGRGFVLALGCRWPAAEQAYRLWARGTHPSMPPFELGWIQIVQVVPNEIFIANMIAQRDIKTSPEGMPPIRYEALSQCLKTLSEEARGLQASVHMPRIGCGLAGGSWERVEPIVRLELVQTGVDVVVYDHDVPGPEIVSWKK